MPVGLSYLGFLDRLLKLTDLQHEAFHVQTCAGNEASCGYAHYEGPCIVLSGQGIDQSRADEDQEHQGGILAAVPHG